MTNKTVQKIYHVIFENHLFGVTALQAAALRHKTKILQSHHAVRKPLVITCRVAWIWAINYFHFSTIKVPVTNSLSDRLVIMENDQKTFKLNDPNPSMVITFQGFTI